MGKRQDVELEPGLPLHARTHPSLNVEGCFGCKVAGVALVLPNSFSTRNPWSRHGSRPLKIIKDNEERRQSLTDLRYGRVVDAETERQVLSAPNFDGIKIGGKK